MNVPKLLILIFCNWKLRFVASAYSDDDGVDTIIKSDETHMCCSDLNMNFSSSSMDCKRETKVRCHELLKNRFIQYRNPVSEITHVYFHTDLLFLDNLSFSGILELTLKITIKWWNPIASWNRNTKMCHERSDACRLFVNRTQHIEHSIYALHEVYKFELDKSTKNTPLSSPTHARVYRDGTIENVEVMHVAINCNMNVRKFPFDRHICPISWKLTQGLFEVQHIVTEDDRGLSKAASNAEWSLKKFTTHNGIYYLELERVPYEALTTLFLPVFLFGFLVDLVYIVPLSCGERMGYSVTLVLSFTMVIMSMNELVPPSSTLTVIGEYI